MSGDLSILAPKDEDISKLLMAGSHLGSRNLCFQMKKYVYKRRSDGVHIINLHKTWEKLLLAARIIVAIENPQDVCALSGPQYGQRAVLKFATHVGATPCAGRFTPGTFTNQIQKAFQEPRLLICTDPRVDHQPILEASYVNLPTVAFCDSDSPLRYVDVAIPGNNKSIHSVGLLWWMLAREVLRFRASISRTTPWDIMPDLYFYRDLEEVEKEEIAAKELEQPAAPEWSNDAAVPAGQDWGAAALPAATGLPATQGALPTQFTAPAGDDWSATPPAQDWNTAPTGWDAPAPAQAPQ